MAKSPLVLPLADSPPQQQTSLFSTPEPEQVRLLWLAIHLPKLAIELNRKTPNAILVATEQSQGRSIIHSTSLAAELQGISVGMQLNAAYALCPKIQTVEYNSTQQHSYMKRIALWAGQFSSKISVPDDSTLLLEALGSCRLFGGLTKLVEHISDTFNRQWPHQFTIAVTPSPAASVLLAKTHKDTIIVKHYAALRSTLGSVAIKQLPLAKKTKIQLHRLGLKVLRDLWRLPKEDVARRYGRELTAYLDTLTGILPAPQQLIQAPEQFNVSWVLDDETRDGKIVTRIVKELLERLVRFLQERDACINEYTVVFRHRKKKPSLLCIRLRKPGRDLARFILLFEERFEQYVLSSAVDEVSVFIRQTQNYVSHSRYLPLSPEFIQAETVLAQHIEDLLEVFQVRLGKQAIKTLHTVADHRPEHAYGFNMVSAGKETIGRRGRPLWLLPEPRQLQSEKHGVYYDGVLSLLAGPERIESGWWSGQETRRDYYIALAKSGQRLWIYQELSAPYQWYLHGFFA